MKKYLLILFVMLGSFSILKAQDGNDTRAEKIKSLKIAFITQKLQLSTDEAQKFWPIYDQYENEINSLRLENKNATVIGIEEKLLTIRKKYLGSFEKVIGPQRVNKLFIAEKDFRSILIQRLKNRNQQRLGKLRH
jgi:hypothetical protein